MSIRGVHIEIQDLSHRYTAKSPITFDKVNLESPPGEVLAIIGRSGCGKSTLLHILAGLLHSTSGKVHLDDAPVEKPSPRWPRMAITTRNESRPINHGAWPAHSRGRRWVIIHVMLKATGQAFHARQDAEAAVSLQNDGFHLIHHLSSRIPNYNLERCHHSHPVFQQVKPITIRTSLKSLAYRLWDEQLNKLVGYRRMREVRREQAAAKAVQGEKAAVQNFENEGGHVATPEKRS